MSTMPGLERSFSVAALIASFTAFITAATIELFSVKVDFTDAAKAVFIVLICSKYYFYSISLPLLLVDSKNIRKRRIKFVQSLQATCIVGSHAAIAFANIFSWSSWSVAVLVLFGLIFTYTISVVFDEIGQPNFWVDAAVGTIFLAGLLVEYFELEDSIDPPTMYLLLSFFVIPTIFFYLKPFIFRAGSRSKRPLV